jgi:hypothetical protein
MVASSAAAVLVGEDVGQHATNSIHRHDRKHSCVHRASRRIWQFDVPGAQAVRSRAGCAGAGLVAGRSVIKLL